MECATETCGGVLAVSVARAAEAPDVAAAVVRAGHQGVHLIHEGSNVIARWGSHADGVGGWAPIVLSGPPRLSGRDVDPPEWGMDDSSHGRVSGDRLTPPFAAVRVNEGQINVTVDFLAYAHVYHRSGSGWSAISTSARALAHLGDARIDRQGIAIQASLGWQLDDRTLYEGVRKLGPGYRLTLSEGSTSLTPVLPLRRPEPWTTAEEAAGLAAEFLRTYMTTYLAAHPDAILQLSGGIDTRVLLAAIPPRKRSTLRAMTLATSPTSGDVAIARILASRVNMRHLVGDFSDIEKLSSGEANSVVDRAARRLEGMSDPVAHAALQLAEAQFPQGDRIAGTGGEVARGFYYGGITAQVPVLSTVTMLAAHWLMFANGSVEPTALEPGFRSWAQSFATAEVDRLLKDPGLPWPQATDHFYMFQRMQRWSGVIDAAVRPGRLTVNPMLDQGFLSIVDRLRPKDRHGLRFLSRVVCTLDPELGSIPLDARQAPIAYISPRPRDQVMAQARSMKKAMRKIRQRTRHATIPPAGGTTLAEKTLNEWRSNPELLVPVRTTGVVDNQWLDRILGGAPSSAAAVGFLATLASLT